MAQVKGKKRFLQTTLTFRLFSSMEPRRSQNIVLEMCYIYRKSHLDSPKNDFLDIAVMRVFIGMELDAC